MVQWWEGLPPTTVACVRLPDLRSHTSQICSWFSSLHEEFFSTIPLILPPPQKPTFQFNLKTVDKKSHFVECPMLNPISIIIIIIAILNIII